MGKRSFGCVRRLARQSLSILVGLLLLGASVGDVAAEQTLVFCSAAKEQKLVVYRLDESSGQLTEWTQLKLPGEPGALTMTRDGRLLLVALRSTGQLASVRVEANAATLKLVNVVDAGADPAQISVDQSGRFLLTAYYVAAKVSVHRIGDDGALDTQPLQVQTTADKAHAIVLDRSNRFAYVPHTGPNLIFQFAWDSPTGRLTPLTPARLQRPERTGPRHVAWHPTKPIAYVDNEQGNSVTAYRVRQDGTLDIASTATTLPADFRGENATAEIKVHPTGRWLYVSNRGHDSLARVAIDAAGTELSFVDTHPTEKTPRSFDLDSQGQFLVAAGESSGRLEICRISASSGELTRVQTRDVGPMLWWVHLDRR